MEDKFQSEYIPGFLYLYSCQKKYIVRAHKGEVTDTQNITPYKE